MKKNVVIVISLGILLGYLFGKLIYGNYENNVYQDSDGNIYYVQYGVYKTENVAKENANKLDNYIIRELDDKYYIYLGVTTSYNTALQIQNFYKEKNIYTYIRSDYVNNSETLDILKQFDSKIKDEEDISKVMKEIFENKELDI